MRASLFLIALVAASATATAQSVTLINPPGLSTPRTYSHVVKAGPFIFVAGQVATDEKGVLVGTTMAEQLERALANLEIALRSQARTGAMW